MFKGVNFLLKYCWKFDKKYVIYLFLAQIVDALIPLISIIMPKYILDELLGQKRINLLIIYVGILIGYNFLGTVLSNFLHGNSFLHKNTAFNKFQLLLGKKLSEADFEQLEKPSFLDLKEKAHKFLYGDQEGFATVLEKAAGIIGKIFIFASIIAIISTLNFVIVILFILLVLLNSFVDSKVQVENTNINMQKTPYERRGMYLQGLLEDFSYGKEVRIGKLGNWLLNKYDKQIKTTSQFYNRSVKNTLKSWHFASFTSFLQQSLAYGYLIFKVISKAFSIGSFTMYLNAVNTFSGAMKDVMNSIVDVRRFNTYYDAVEKYLNVEHKLRDGKKFPLPKGPNYTFEFVNVSFKYSGQSRYALKNLSIKLKADEKLSIVGENGSGKTTFVKLLTRLYDPTDGQILLNGINIKDIDYDEYMSLFSVVFQDYKLFSLSLKENIALADSGNANDKDVINAIERSGFNSKFEKLDKGLETSIYKNYDETGFEPSGGEGQKIAIARALYKNAPIVILDEPTAALDPHAEYEIYNSFNDLVNGKMAVYISHRLSSARFCDNIAVFDDGKIIEYGTHDELLNLNGKYAELFNMQAQYYIA